jgi:hypothetical protein
MGWNYAMSWLTVFPFELVAAGLTVRYWNDNLHGAIFITIFWVAIVIINLAGVKGYGEAEFVFSIIKVTAVIGFIILGIVIDAGGSPSGIKYGTTYWHDPGSFNNGFKGVCSVFVTAAFAFAGTELAGLAAAETVPSQILTANLMLGESSENITKSNETSYLANYYILHGFTCYYRLYRPIHRTTSSKRRVFHRHQSLPFCHRSPKCRNQSRSLNHERSHSHLCPFRRKLLHLRRNTNPSSPR